MYDVIVEDVKPQLINKKRRISVHENGLFEPRFTKYHNFLYNISKSDEKQTEVDKIKYSEH